MNDSVYTELSAETVEQYQALRGSCGLVDYEGVGLFTVSGGGAAAFLSSVSTRTVDFLLEGQISPALLLHDDGTVLAEALIQCLGQEYRVEVWPAQAAAAGAHLLAAAQSAADVTVVDVSGEFRVLGLEGPDSFRIVQKFLPFPVASMAYRSFVTTELQAGVPVLISRIGVTGEYGYTMQVPAANAADLRADLVALGVRECGVEAIDICRMETRFANLEREADGVAVTPFGLGLQWMVDFGHEFVGKNALLARWEKGERLPVCWTADDGTQTVPANGAPVSSGGIEVGTVAHAVFSPTLGRVIGTARVDPGVAAAGLQLTVGADLTVRTVSAPFLVATSFGVPLE